MKDKADQGSLDCTRDHEAERRRKEVQEWLKRREWGADAAPIVQKAIDAPSRKAP
jgi:hypothetical protein